MLLDVAYDLYTKDQLPFWNTIVYTTTLLHFHE
jgi:hypothetical protein